jgi:hypothetical protein
MEDLLNELKRIAKENGLNFYLHTHTDQKLMIPKKIVLHTYGVQRQQSAKTISEYVTSSGLYAHIYINCDKFNYLLIEQMPERRAVHCGVGNVDSIGIELNEKDGDVIVSERTQKVANLVVDALNNFYGQLPIFTHRDITGKNCPFQLRNLSASRVLLQKIP